MVQNDFAEKRSNLSALLMDLLDRQSDRRAELLETLQCLERSHDDATEDFWLRQYQGLLNRYLFYICSLLMKSALTSKFIKHLVDRKTCK